MIMMADAIFYGYSTDREPMGDLTASACISLIGTIPVYLIRILFQWAKPRVVPSAKSRNDLRSPLASNDAMSPDALDTNSPASTVSPFPVAVEMDTELKTDERDGENMGDDEYMAKMRKTGQIHDTNTAARLSNTYWSAIKELRHATRPDMKLVRKCMHYVNTRAAASEKASLASEVRNILFNYNYPFPHCYKKMAWAILVLICAMCMVFSVAYGIQFDIASGQAKELAESESNLLSSLDAIENSSACWNISKFAQIEHVVLGQELNATQIAQERLAGDVADVNADADDFVVPNDATKWLLNVLISFLASVFFWQPLSIYLLTWMKIWAFHNGLIMEASVYNIWVFLCCCCARSRKHKITKHQTGKMLEFGRLNSATADGGQNGKADFAHYVPEDSEMYDRELSVSGSGFAACVNDDRALDVIGFLCNDELFVDLPDDFESSYTTP